MTDDPLVSIIIPIYNTEDYLKECIDSCISQAYSNKEIILVDDGSTDDSRLIIEVYKHMYPNLVRVITKTNGGIASALNAGIRQANGDWIKWLSSDDKFYDPLSLHKFMEEIQENFSDEEQQMTIFCSEYDIIDSNSKVRSNSVYLYPESHILQRPRIYRSFFGNATTSLIRKEVFKMAGLFDETLPFNEDYDFWMRCIIKYQMRIFIAPVITACYRQHDKQLTFTKSRFKNQIVIDKIRKRYYQYLTDAEKTQIEYASDYEPWKKRLFLTACRLWTKLDWGKKDV